VAEPKVFCTLPTAHLGGDVNTGSLGNLSCNSPSEAASATESFTVTRDQSSGTVTGIQASGSASVTADLTGLNTFASSTATFAASLSVTVNAVMSIQIAFSSSGGSDLGSSAASNVLLRCVDGTGNVVVDLGDKSLNGGVTRNDLLGNVALPGGSRCALVASGGGFINRLDNSTASGSFNFTATFAKQ